MPGHIPTLDDNTLRRLRDFIAETRSSHTQSLPLGQLVELGQSAPMDAGVTIDLEATEQLGVPMVVVRLPTEPLTTDILRDLSPRELDIAGLIAKGLANKQIARRLSLTLGTVKGHVHRILQKTALPNRAAIAVAHRKSPSWQGGVRPVTAEPDAR